MIRKSEINKNDYRLTAINRHNLHYLYLCLNEIRAEWKRPMIIKSGIRSRDEHIQIYRTINTQRATEGKPPLFPPMGSAHLKAAAVDVYDPKHELYDFINSNWDLWESLDLDIYMEHRDFTESWTHIQTTPTRSGNRIFIPY